jgi:4-alpha-glucanotransferase
MVAYLGTHDNDPLKGFYEKLPAEEKAAWLQALDARKVPSGDINERLINYALSLNAGYAIFALQDLLDLGSESRLNVPGVIDDVNWTWRMKDFSPFKAKVEHYRSLNALYRR